MRRKLGLLSLLMLWTSFGLAQTYVELILDASGSMFNQLEDGRYRIVAAKEVLRGFISSLPEDPELNVGLRVYGSQTGALDEGACEDSELFAPLEGVAREALLQAVQGAEAQGATPIAYSLQEAANDLQGLEGRKLIVLVTDGEESCGGDLRAVVEAIKAQGVEVDIRVIGFDLTPEAQASFEGVGTFENAASAAELAAALGRAVESAVEETEAAYPVTVSVTRGSEPAADGAAVTFTEAVSGESYPFTRSEPGTFAAELPAGAYSAQVEDAFSEAPESFGGLTVTPEAENAFSFELEAEVEVTLLVTPSDPTAGGNVSVTFEGAPKGEGNWVALAPTEAPDEVYLDWEYVSGATGQLELRVPAQAQALEARYHLTLPEGGVRVIGRSEPFSSQQAEVSLEAPGEVLGGAAFDVTWTGPDNEDDYVTIVRVGASEGSYLDYAYTRDGNPLTLTAPVEAGDYEVRYSTEQGGATFASVPITVTAGEYGVQAPAEALGGAEFEVTWTGPDNDGDYITVVPAGASEGTYRDYAYTNSGNPVTITAPLEPGQYEVRYSTEQQSPNPTLASAPITVTGASYSVTAPAEVTAGEDFEVTWSGPDNQGDYITIVPSGAPEGTYTDYFYTRNGNPGALTAPDEPGQYEIRYSSEQASPNPTLASSPITVR